MNTTAEDQIQDGEAPEADAMEVPPAGSRRLLIGATTGGLVLAASGLILPEWREEANAREGALGGAKGGRRGQDHRGRRGRTHGAKKAKRKDQDKPRGALPGQRNLAIAVHNYRPTAVRLRGWQGTCASPAMACPTWEMPTHWDWKALAGRTGDQHFGTEFASARKQVAVQIFDYHVVSGWLGSQTWVGAEIRTGGWGDRGATGGQTLTSSRRMVINESIAADGIKIIYVGFNGAHEVLSVDLT